MADLSTPATGLDEETTLIKCAQQGDLHAFEVLMQRYEHRLFRLAQQLMGNSADAEDVLQETFLKVYTKIGQFQFHSRLYTWMVRIAMNEGLMKLRQRRVPVVSLDADDAERDRPPAADLADWHPNPEQQFAHAELRQILQTALNTLSLPYRIVFQLRDVEQLSTAETADALGLSEAAVKSRLLRARLQLRQQLTKHFRLGGLPPTPQEGT